MKPPLRVLLVEDNEADAQLVLRELRKSGRPIEHTQVQMEADFRRALAEQTWDLIIADYSLPRFNGLAALNILAETTLDVPFIIVSGTIGEDIAVQGMKAGAHDYLLKDRLNRLVPAVERELRDADERRRRRRAEKSLRDSEIRQALYLSQTPLAVIEWNLNFEVVSWNPAAETIFGYSAQEALGRHASFIVPSSVHEYLDNLWRQLLERRGGYRGTNQNLTRTGELIECEWYNTPLVDQHGQIIAVTSLAHNITDRLKAERALRESEARWRTLLESAAEFIITVDAAGNILAANRPLPGFAGEALVGTSLLDFGRPENRPLLQRQIVDAFEHRQTTYFEFPVQLDSGNAGWFACTLGPVINDNRVVAALGMVNDITERKREEETLQSILKGTAWALGKDFFRSLVLELAKLLNARFAMAAELVDTQPRRMRTLAFCADGKLAENVEFDFAGTPCEAALMRGQYFFPEHLQTLFPTVPFLKDHKLESYLCAPLISLSSEALGLVAVMHDQPMQESERGRSILTIFAGRAAAEMERLRAESALQENEERYRLLVENSTELVTEVTTDGRFLYVSPTYETILGYDRTKLVGTDIFKPIHPDDLPNVLLKFQMPQASASFRYQHQDGSWRWLDASGRRFRTSAGEERAVIVSRDITDRKQAEESRSRLEAQLRQAQKMDSLGRLAGGIAHDFNNMLTAIMGHTELARMDCVSLPKVQHSLEQVLKAAHRAKELVQQILTFSRRQEQKRAIIKLGPVVQEALKLLRSSLPATIEMDSHLADCPTVLADPTQIHQVVMNLCTNAAQAIAGNKGIIRVHLTPVTIDEQQRSPRRELKPGHFVVLTISDNGCGMDTAMLERIFEPFFTTKPAGQGTGLGLAVVHGIVENHDGIVTVDSAVGQGTKFTIYLPVVEGEVAAEATETTTIYRGKGEEVMVIDDELPVLQIAERLFSRLGYRTSSFDQPVKAIEEFEKNPHRFALVVTDLTMPRLTGVDVARQLVQIRPDIPIILATGYGGSIDSETAKQIGFRLLLSKPYQLTSLAQAASRAIRGETTPQANA